MGTWGTGLFADDLACDIRDHYRELIEDGIEDDAATRLTVEKYRAYLEEPDGVALLALAVTQARLGDSIPISATGRWTCSTAAPTSTNGSARVRSNCRGDALCLRKRAHC